MGQQKGTWIRYEVSGFFFVSKAALALHSRICQFCFYFSSSLFLEYVLLYRSNHICQLSIL